MPELMGDDLYQFLLWGNIPKIERDRRTACSSSATSFGRVERDRVEHVRKSSRSIKSSINIFYKFYDECLMLSFVSSGKCSNEFYLIAEYSLRIAGIVRRKAICWTRSYFGGSQLIFSDWTLLPWRYERTCHDRNRNVERCCRWSLYVDCYISAVIRSEVCLLPNYRDVSLIDESCYDQ